MRWFWTKYRKSFYFKVNFNFFSINVRIDGQISSYCGDVARKVNIDNFQKWKIDHFIARSHHIWLHNRNQSYLMSLRDLTILFWISESCHFLVQVRCCYSNLTNHKVWIITVWFITHYYELFTHNLTLKLTGWTPF